MSIVEIRGGPVTVPKLLKKSRHEIARQCVEALDGCDKLRARAEEAEAGRDAWWRECARLRGMLRRLIEPPEPAEPMSADDILARLTEHRQTHAEWASWFEQNPDDPRAQGEVGNAAFHRKVEADYDRMIAGVERLKAAAGQAA